MCELAFPRHPSRHRLRHCRDTLPSMPLKRPPRAVPPTASAPCLPGTRAKELHASPIVNEGSTMREVRRIRLAAIAGAGVLCRRRQFRVVMSLFLLLFTPWCLSRRPGGHLASSITRSFCTSLVHRLPSGSTCSSAFIPPCSTPDPNDDRAIYCSFSETNFVYLWRVRTHWARDVTKFQGKGRMRNGVWFPRQLLVCYLSNKSSCIASALPFLCLLFFFLE